MKSRNRGQSVPCALENLPVGVMPVHPWLIPIPSLKQKPKKKKIIFCHSQEKEVLKTTVIREGRIPSAQFLLPFLSFSTSRRDIMQRCTFTSVYVWYYRKSLCFYVLFFTNTQIALGTPETVPEFQGVKLVPQKGYLTVRFLDVLNSGSRGPTWSYVIPVR